MSEALPDRHLYTEVPDSTERYEQRHTLAKQAVDALRQYCAGPVSFCREHDCELTVSLRNGHPVAVAVNRWYESLGGTLSIAEDLEEWFKDAGVRRESPYDKILELWHEFTTFTCEVGDIPFARQRGSDFADYVESLYADGPPVDRKVDAKSRSGRVVLFGLGSPVEVDGKMKDALDANQYAIVKLLVKNPDGKSNSEMKAVTNHSDPRVVLIRLMQDGDWAKVIRKVKKPGKREVIWTIE